MNRQKALLVFICGLLLLTFNIKATEYRLFKNGEFAPNYSEIMEKIMKGEIKKGDTLIFSKRSFVMDSFLGNGGTTVVVSLNEGDQGENRVLRMAKTPEIKSEADDWKVDRDYLQEYLQGYRKLRKLDVPVPHVYDKESEESENGFEELEYVLVENMDISFTLKEFYEDIRKGEKDQLERTPRFQLNKEEVENIESRLKILALETYQIYSIEDLHSDNVIYSNGKWMLLDFCSKIKTIDNAFGRSGREAFQQVNFIFDNFPISPTVKGELRSFVKQLRENMLALEAAKAVPLACAKRPRASATPLTLATSQKKKEEGIWEKMTSFFSF